jgi:sugar phosphate permease
MSQPHQPPLTERPTKVRYCVLALLCLLAFILYVDRICLGQAAKDIREELGLTKTEIGYVHTAFTVAYSLFEVPAGWWGDKYGSRGVLARIVVWWSVFTALTGGGWGLTSLIVIRFLFGVGEAGAFPNSAQILARWMPLEERGKAQGLVNSMAQIGGVFAPLLTAFLIAWIGWRWTFAVYCLPGLMWAAVFYSWYRDDPQTHPSVNAAERSLIQAGTQKKSGEHPPIPWRAVLSHEMVWLLGLVLACGAFNTYLYFSWYPDYLKEGRNVSPKLAGGLASLVLTGGAIGCISGGFLCDLMAKLPGDPKRSRRLWCCFAFWMGAVLLLIGKQCDSPVIASTWTAASVMFTLSTLASWWSAVTEVSGRHLGALFGLMNSLGGLGAIASQQFVGRFADWMESRGHTGRAQWDPMFYVYAGVLAVGGLTWLLIHPRRSVEDAPSDL